MDATSWEAEERVSVSARFSELSEGRRHACRVAFLSLLTLSCAGAAFLASPFGPSRGALSAVSAWWGQALPRLVVKFGAASFQTPKAVQQQKAAATALTIAGRAESWASKDGLAPKGPPAPGSDFGEAYRGGPRAASSDPRIAISARAKYWGRAPNDLRRSVPGEPSSFAETTVAATSGRRGATRSHKNDRAPENASRSKSLEYGFGTHQAASRRSSVLQRQPARRDWARLNRQVEEFGGPGHPSELMMPKFSDLRNSLQAAGIDGEQLPNATKATRVEAALRAAGLKDADLDRLKRSGIDPENVDRINDKPIGGDDGPSRNSLGDSTTRGDRSPTAFSPDVPLARPDARDATPRPVLVGERSGPTLAVVPGVYREPITLPSRMPPDSLLHRPQPRADQPLPTAAELYTGIQAMVAAWERAPTDAVYEARQAQIGGGTMARGRELDDQLRQQYQSDREADARQATLPADAPR
ncbi:MAG: hypothetical protein HY059_09460 [Proteobacteria bacterium]|nr:hypothetical protein [Pseudomonadota bacterium]